MNAPREFRPIYEVCEGIGTQAEVLFTTDDPDDVQVRGMRSASAHALVFRRIRLVDLQLVFLSL